jgi:hypothetical protein
LGNELYNELREFSPSIWGNLPKQFDKLFEQNFENGMKDIFNNSFFVPSLMREMAKYFCAFRPNNNSNLYTKLIREIKDSLKETVFSTLHYDLIFELALQSQDLFAEYFS